MIRPVLRWLCALALATGCSSGDAPGERVTTAEKSAHATDDAPSDQTPSDRAAAETAADTPPADTEAATGQAAEKVDGPGDPPEPSLSDPAALGAGAADPGAATRAVVDAPRIPRPTAPVAEARRVEPARAPAPVVTVASEPAGTIGLGAPGIVGRGAPSPRIRTLGRDLPPRRTEPEPPDDPFEYASGALGLSPPIQLYTFRADPDRGLAAHPRQCRPERILEAVVAVVNRARGRCSAQRNRLVQAGLELAYVTCRVPEEVAGCHRTYVGTLWVERTPGTHHDYQLQAFGRVARQCGARVEGIAGPIEPRFAGHAPILGRLFDLCGQRVTGEATSTSVSSRPESSGG